ncbi:hypothetical protein [Xanthomonas sontii]|nr:hypothetical protein [Xanthomonas sontii]
MKRTIWLAATVAFASIVAIFFFQKKENNENSLSQAQLTNSAESSEKSLNPEISATGKEEEKSGPSRPAKKSIRHPFPEVPQTRRGMSFENDPFFAESKAEQAWLDRHGYPNEKQWEAYMTAPEALLKEAADAGDMAAKAILDARLLPTDQQAQQRLIDAGAEGNLFALNMLASYQGGASNGDPVAAYALSRVLEMRGDTRAGITRDAMITKPLSTQQRTLGESEALRINDAINNMYKSKYGTDPKLDKRPIGAQ